MSWSENYAIKSVNSTVITNITIVNNRYLNDNIMFEQWDANNDYLEMVVWWYLLNCKMWLPRNFLKPTPYNVFNIKFILFSRDIFLNTMPNIYSINILHLFLAPLMIIESEGVLN